MSGLANLIPYFECQYPQVLPLSNEQASAVINSAGMGEYLDGFGWPIPQYLSPGNPRGLGCADCGGTCGGLGMALTAPGGFFSTDQVSQWGGAEWGAVGIGLYAIISAWGDAKRLGPKVSKGSKRAGKAAKSGVSGLGTIAIIAAAGAGLYMWSQSNAAAGAQ